MLRNVLRYNTYADSASDDTVVDGVVVQVAVTVDSEHFVRRVMTPELAASSSVDRQQTAQTRPPVGPDFITL